jgi:hypothetical protein
MLPIFRLALSFFALALCGCAGYQLGSTSGFPAGTRSIQVNFFQNDTLEPRLSEAVAISLRRNLQQDGTFLLDTRGGADVVVNGVLVDYQRTALSFHPEDILTPRDLGITLTAKVTAIERITGKVLLDQLVSGRTSLRIFSDLAGAEQQHFPLLADDLSRNITELLVDGTW